jgi:hypothetical protein
MKQNPDTPPAAEILFSGEGEAQDRALRRQAARGALRRIYAGVYTTNLDSPLEKVVNRNWAAIVSHLLPGAVLAYRSALEQRPLEGVLHVRRERRRRRLELPGLRVEVYPDETGPLQEPPAKDVPYQGIYIPSEARGFLENMAGGRGKSTRTLPQKTIEAKLDKILTLRGDFKLNDLRDQARAIAGKLGLDKESQHFDGIIGALLGTHEKKMLHSRQALARAAGKPFDPDRLELFDVLHAALAGEVFAHPADPAGVGIARENFAFFEAYFSNFIEGTTFEVEEAQQIIFQGALIPNRTEDSHDIQGTFQAIISTPWRNAPAQTGQGFLSWLKSVNALVMQARQDKNPGQWKERANMAGNTLFVEPQLVPGTLIEAFSRIQALTDAVARALMTMFVISEVHPFQDGNGRTARLAMNAVLSSAGLCRIIIPTVYREDYLLPLKRLTNERDASPYIRSMTRVLDWTSRFDYGQALPDVHAQLARCNAFQEDLKNYRLTFP